MLVQPTAVHGVAITRSGKYANYQFSRFDERGFISDHEVATLADGLCEAVESGFTKPAPTLLDELALTDEFAAGNELTLRLNGLVKDDASGPPCRRATRQRQADPGVHRRSRTHDEA